MYLVKPPQQILPSVMGFFGLLSAVALVFGGVFSAYGYPLSPAIEALFEHNPGLTPLFFFASCSFFMATLMFKHQDLTAPARKTPVSPSQQTDHEKADKVAALTSWEPIRSGGSRHKNKQVCESRYKQLSVVSYGGSYWPAVITVICCGTYFLWLDPVTVLREIPTSVLIAAIMTICVGIAYMAVTRYKNSIPITFDKYLGWVWRAKGSDDATMVALAKSQGIKLEMLHALQIVSEDCKETTGSGENRTTHYFKSYELNLVLTDSSRVNLMDHAHLDSVVADAKQLSEFLEIPVWDRP